MGAKDIQRFSFQPGQSGNPKGRPKNAALEQLRQIQTKARRREYKEMTKEDFDHWDAVLLCCGADELKVIAQDPKTPMYAKGMALALFSDLKNGRTKAIEALYIRRFGKPKQTMELTGKDGTALMPERSLTKEQATEFYKQLEENFKGKASGNDIGKE